MKLNIKVLRPNLISERKNYATDSGVDLYSPERHIIPPRTWGYKIPLGISAKNCNGSGYYLYPRSSISKTPMRLCNSVGIIDVGYRGEIMAVVDNLSDQQFIVETDKSYFQLCCPDLLPIEVEFVDELDSTERGEGGFGSTDNRIGF
jgi:dUTP pyrophosphatase